MDTFGSDRSYKEDFMHCLQSRPIGILIILIWITPVFDLQANRGQYPIKNFAPADYGAGIQNIDFAQNRDMSLFVANNLGVLSFNGITWGKHAINTGKKQRSLAFDETSNRLYVGSQGEFGFFEDNWRYVSLITKIPEEFRNFDEVWDVFAFESKMYFCTFQGIYVYDGKIVHVITRPGGFNRSFVVGNRLFTQSSTGALFEIDGLDLTPQVQRNTGQVVAGVYQVEVGYVVVYNSGKAELLNYAGVDSHYALLSDAIAGKYVNHVAQISDGRVVISTQLSGLYIYNPITDEIENISISDGLLSNACLRVFQDHSGNLWVGMQNGIAQIDINSPLRLINKNIELQGSGYEAFELDEGTYYTTSNGIYFLAKGEKKSNFLLGTEGPAYGMQLIGNKLYAGHHTGLFLLENGRASRRGFCNGLWQVKSLRSKPGYAIGGTYSGLHLFKMDAKGQLQDAGKIEGFDESSRFFEEDRQGRLWVGQYYKGLYLITLNDSITKVTVKNVSDAYQDLPIQKYIFLTTIDDQIYVCTANGVFVLDQATDKIIEEDVFSKVIGKHWVYQLVQDQQKNVYVYTDQLVGFFKKVSPDNYMYVPSSLFQLRHSFNNDLLSVSRNIKNGVLFNANEGFIQYTPELEDIVLSKNEPLVSRVINVAEDSVLYTGMPFQARPMKNEVIRITEGTRILQFLVESFKFKDISNQQFKYFLSGFDEGFSDWTSSNIKEYTNLKVGSYQFRVQTLNARGETVTSEPLLVEVSPPFYKSPLAWAFYVLLVLLVLYQLYWLQRGYYRAKQKRLEQAKQNELAQKQNELQALREEQVSRELSHVNTLLAASTMNLVVKNEFMETIKEEIRQAKATDKVEDKQRALERIIKEIDTTLRVQEDWKQFEHHFDQIHGDFLKRLSRQYPDLTPGEQKLCAFLRLNMDTKEIANLMAISLRGVEVTRYRLRKKFKLETHQNLSKFILEF